MTVPGRIEAAHLLRSLDPPDWLLRHSRAVAEVAGWLAAQAMLRGTPVDRRTVEAAALLHDVDKAMPREGPLRGLAHGEASAAWLSAAGHAELGPMVTIHPVTRLVDGEWFETWLARARSEELIVAYADKRAGQRLEPMDARFASWRRRYPGLDSAGRLIGWDDETYLAVRERAARLELAVCALAGTDPGAVRRLGWTTRALRAADRAA